MAVRATAGWGCPSIVLAEGIGRFITSSLALILGADHMLTDIAALLLTILALWFTGKPVTHQKTYGYYRMEILAALANGGARYGASLIDDIYRATDIGFQSRGCYTPVEYQS